MFPEYASIALTEPVPLQRLYDVPPDSPLLAAANPGDGLRPGDIGIVIDINPNGTSFLAEFLEPGGYTVALADLCPAQARLATDADRLMYRFGRTALSQRPAAWRGGNGFAEYTNIVLTKRIPQSEIRYIPEGSPLHAADNPEVGLRPGSVGFIASIDRKDADTEVLSVDFMDIDGRLLAAAKIRPDQCRPATPADRANYRRRAQAATAG